MPVADVTQGEGAAKQGISRAEDHPHARMMRGFVFLPADSVTPFTSGFGAGVAESRRARLRLLPPPSVY